MLNNVINDERFSLIRGLYKDKTDDDWRDVLSQFTIKDAAVFFESFELLLKTWLPRFVKKNAEITWQANSSLAREIQPFIAKRLSNACYLAVLADDQDYFTSKNLTPDELIRSLKLACLIGRKPIIETLFDRFPEIIPSPQNAYIFDYLAFSEPEWIPQLLETHNIPATALSDECITTLYTTTSFEFVQTFSSSKPSIYSMG